MSLDSWKEKYYPVDAKEVPVSEALDHSLRKWEGLRPLVLEAHGLTKHGNNLDDPLSDKNNLFSIDGDSCALCVHHLKDSDDDEDEDESLTRCDGCPLYQVLGKLPCDYGVRSPYATWAKTGDPEFMIAALTRAKQFGLEKAQLEGGSE